MKSFAITAAALLAAPAALAQPLATRNGNGAYANLMAINNPIGSGTPAKTPVNVPLGQLTTFDLEVTSLQLESVTVSVPDVPKVDASKVTCQRYNDAYGVQPGSAPFNTTVPADISTNEVSFGWVLCYVTSSL